MTLTEFKYQLKNDSLWWETMQMVHRGKNIEEVIGFAYLDMLSQPLLVKKGIKISSSIYRPSLTQHKRLLMDLQKALVVD